MGSRAQRTIRDRSIASAKVRAKFEHEIRAESWCHLGKSGPEKILEILNLAVVPKRAARVR
jgi:hypothetical protein